MRSKAHSPIGPLPAGWRLAHLSEIAVKIGSGATPRGGQKAYIPQRTTFAFIRSQNVYDYYFEGDELIFITDDDADKLKGVHLKEHDILLNITGDGVTFARCCIVPEHVLPAAVNQHVSIIRLDQSECLPGYLLSYLCHPGIKDYIASFNAGGSRRAITKGHIESFEVPLPPLKVQEMIQRTAFSLLDKIQLNHQINQTLEKMAQAIFKSWFVDFEPVKAKIAALEAGGSEEDALLAAMQAISGKGEAELARLQAEQPEQYAELRTTAELFPSAMQESELGEIPEGWGVAPFSKIAQLDTTSVKPSSSPDVLWEHYSIPAFDDGGSPAFELGADIKSNKYKVHPTAILSSKLNPHFPRTWWPDVTDEGAAICSTEFMQFVPLVADHRPFTAGLVSSGPFQSGIMMRVTGSTGSRQRAQPKQVAAMDVILPPENLVVAFSKRTEAMYLSRARNIKQSNTLACLRDALLPKLLSGELALDAQPEQKEVVNV